MNRFLQSLVVAAVAVGLAGAACQAGPEEWDDRFGVVATDTSGWGGPIIPLQGAEYFERLRAPWWYNYSAKDITTRNWPGYQRLYMYWRATLATSDASIQAAAAEAKAWDPNHTIWFAMSNEPNDRGQANQTPEEFAPIYYKFHKNLKIGDPNCKIIPPGILNWTFQSTSVWMKGKDWYEAFRQAWTSNEICRNYSLDNYGTPYPPLDGFNLHSYDLRWGTPQSWQYCRDEILACYNDLQTWPECAGKKIWLTEFSDLRAPSMTENAGLSAGLVLWMKQQPFMERWFWFFTHGDRYASFPSCWLLDSYGELTPVGMAHRDLSLLSPSQMFHHIPFHAGHGSGTSYVRDGSIQDTGIGEDTSISLKFYLNYGYAYSPTAMRGRTYVPADGRIKRVTFNYTTNYDNSKICLVMDVPGTNDKWKLDRYGGSLGYADIDLTGQAADSVSFAFVPSTSFTYSRPTGEWYASVSNITLYLVPVPPAPVVTDEGVYTTSSTSLHASWSGSGSDIVEYRYAVGSTSGGTDVVPWTSAGTNTQADIRCQLTAGGVYFISVKALNSEGVWSAAGVSDGIRVVSVAGIAQSKEMPDGTNAAVSGIVTAGNDQLYGLVFVESADRASALKIYPASGANAAAGDMITAVGVLTTSNGDRALSNSQIQVISRDHPVPPPLAMTTRSAGGADLNQYALGVTRGTGPNNIALLIRLFGKVTGVSTVGKYFIIDDGARDAAQISTQVRVDWGLTLGGITPPAVGSYVQVTGISAMRSSGGSRIRTLRPRGSFDVVPVSP